jgi:hypothetical protein
MWEGRQQTAWVDSIMLEENEKIVANWEGAREILEKITDEKAKHYGKWKVKEHHQGILVLTDRRLLFVEAQENSELPFDAPVEVPLVNLDKSWVEKPPFKSLQETVKFETNVFRLKKKKDYKDLQKLMDKYRDERKKILQQDQNKGVSFKSLNYY